MSSPTLTERRRPARGTPRRARRGSGAGAGCSEHLGPSLEDVVFASLGEIEASGRASCPVCASEGLKAAGCSACGSELF